MHYYKICIKVANQWHFKLAYELQRINGQVGESPLANNKKKNYKIFNR